MKVTLGGDRLGSGNKQEISMRNYERSTHDLGYVWRSSMSAGTLAPFMTEVALPGDSMDIDLDMDIMTLPTIGPLFGSYKVQADVFLIPMRIYNGKLHMNKLGIGNDMSQAKIPQLQLKTLFYDDDVIADNLQINSSCILSYLNIRGVGVPTPITTVTMNRYYNAIPLLGYWDIYKQYYANKQEERGFVIHTANLPGTAVTEAQLQVNFASQGNIYLVANDFVGAFTINGTEIVISLDSDAEVLLENITISRTAVIIPLVQLFESYEQYIEDGVTKIRFWNYIGSTSSFTWFVPAQNVEINGATGNQIELQEFPLENIDTMKELILMDVQSSTAFIIGDANLDSLIAPYSYLHNVVEVDEKTRRSVIFSQEGLGIKTYQSDLFNNWISTEWIDGTGGVNEISSVSTVGDSFTIDALNLASKVYVMLNRIALSGGSYDDWLDAVYTHDRAKSMESPVYMGSLIKELTFQEVISNSATADEPLGTLAGRGTLTNKHKGGSIKISVNEPSYVMGIVSLTPRLDYSQGNKWDTNLKTWNDLHKPALDAIGFEDLITDQMAWFDTQISAGDVINYRSAGKQPAWINYMTNVNQVRGSFAEKTDSMWMTLNRRYEIGEFGLIDDVTTYVDPTKFNQIFADTRLDAQNFWVQIGIKNIARRKMSAKVIPNL